MYNPTHPSFFLNFLPSFLHFLLSFRRFLSSLLLPALTPTFLAYFLHFLLSFQHYLPSFLSFLSSLLHLLSSYTSCFSLCLRSDLNFLPSSLHLIPSFPIQSHLSSLISQLPTLSTIFYLLNLFANSTIFTYLPFLLDT